MVPYVGTGLLLVESRGQGINLAFELGDATVGFLLSLSGWGSRDAAKC
jgi:hypothetical protein